MFGAGDALIKLGKPRLVQFHHYRAGKQAEKFLGGVIGQLDAARGIQDDHGIRQAVDRHLRGLLGAHQPIALDRGDRPPAAPSSD